MTEEEKHAQMTVMLARATRREHGEREPCDLEADPFTDDPEDLENPWHHLRVCLFCGGHWWGLHCPHDGHQNPCMHCGKRPVMLQTECFDAEDLARRDNVMPHLTLFPHEIMPTLAGNRSALHGML